MAEYKNALQELVAERLKQTGDSTRDAAARSHGLISHQNLNQMRLGNHAGKLRDDTISGLALALQITVREVKEAVAETVAPAQFADLTNRLSLLPKAKQQEVFEYMVATLEQHAAEVSGEAQPEAVSSPKRRAKRA